MHDTTLESRVTELEASVKSTKSIANGALAIAVFALISTCLLFAAR